MSLDPKLLDALVAIVELGSFERAAERLRLTQSAISQRIRQLERQVGSPVVVRAEGRATAAGQQLLRYARQLRALEEETLAALDVVDSPWRRIAVAVNADSLATWFADAVAPIIVRPGVLLDIVADDQTRTIEYLRSGAVMACISSRAKPIQGCSAESVGRMRYVCVAAATALERLGRSRFDRTFVANLPAIQFAKHDEIVEKFIRQAVGMDRFQYPFHIVPSSTELLSFTLAGYGYSILPLLQVEPHLACGTLVDVAPGLSHDVELHWHRWKTSTELLDELSRAIRMVGRQQLEYRGQSQARSR